MWIGYSERVLEGFKNFRVFTVGLLLSHINNLTVNPIGTVPTRSCIIYLQQAK